MQPWKHPTHSSLRKESPAELMFLTFVWDKTASGTARSKTDNKHSIPYVAPRCPKGSLVPYKSEGNQFHQVLASLGTIAPMHESSGF